MSPLPQVRILMSARVPGDLRATALEAAVAGQRLAELLLYADREGLAAHLPRAEVCYGVGLRADQVPIAPALRWVHATSAGVDGQPLEAFAAAGVTLTNARGQHAEAMADHAFALLLALSRLVPACVVQQRERRWAAPGATAGPGELAGRRLGILGYGAIGRAVARRAVAFGMEVWASRRHPDAETDAAVAAVVGPSRRELHDLLAACDDIVSILPSTPLTRGLLDAAAFAAMRPGARLINIGRGSVLDEGALEAALRTGRLAGAGCDCLPREPLPPESPLWTAPNLLITPHIGGQHPDYDRRGMAIFAANLTRYCLGEPLENRVDLQAGY